MSYLSENILRSYRTESLLERRSNENLKSWRYEAKHSVFLSHSHDDSDLALGLVRYLSSLGVSVYVDWNDTAMPSATSGETASRIKSQIQSDDYFMFLATKNGCNSRWCPWEIGVADGIKDRDKILIVPVVDPYGKFHGNEYLQIYNRAVIPNQPEKIASVGPDILAVFRPGMSQGGTNLNSYLSR